MKKLIIVCVLFLVATSSYAQPGDVKRSAFHFSFVPPMSTHGKYAAEYTNSVSISLLVGLSKNEEGFSMAGLANVAHGRLNGFQVAGILNYAGDSGKGFMMSGLTNIVRNEYQGFQMAGLLNKADQFRGFQFSGLGNIAGNVKGLQFGGLFNVAKNVSGVQIAGLVNVAESSDCPIGLLNFIKNGEYSIAATYNETGSAIISFRSGGKITYGILGLGYNHKAKKGFTTEGGIGAHINIVSWFRINNEIKAGSIGATSDNSVFYTNYSLLPAFRFAGNFEVFGGPSINYMQTDDIANKNVFPSHSLWKKHTDSRLQQLYIGWQAGVQYIF